MQKEKDVDILARTIYGEARGEPLVGKKAVACVILNRYKSNKWFRGATIADTCTLCVKGSKYHQFSCWNTFDPNRIKILVASQKALAEYYGIARIAIDGWLNDVTNGATHYHHKSLSPIWSRGKIPCCEIGSHKFYKDID